MEKKTSIRLVEFRKVHLPLSRRVARYNLRDNTDS